MGHLTRDAGYPVWASLAGRVDSRRNRGEHDRPRLSWRAVALWCVMADVVRDADDLHVCFMGRDTLSMAYGPPGLDLTDAARRALMDAQNRWADRDLRQLIAVGALRRLQPGGKNHTARFEVLTSRPHA